MTTETCSWPYARRRPYKMVSNPHRYRYELKGGIFHPITGEPTLGEFVQTNHGVGILIAIMKDIKSPYSHFRRYIVNYTEEDCRWEHQVEAIVPRLSQIDEILFNLQDTIDQHDNDYSEWYDILSQQEAQKICNKYVTD